MNGDINVKKHDDALIAGCDDFIEPSEAPRWGIVNGASCSLIAVSESFIVSVAGVAIIE